MGDALVCTESKSKKDLGDSLVVPGRKVKKTAGQCRGHGFDPGSSKRGQCDEEPRHHNESTPTRQNQRKAVHGNNDSDQQNKRKK